ncbi:MAG: LPS export ABC transporter periplasmic protein LptC [Bacteroidales bacterium]|nr:LPS export ABC transporter periplasmic protein LptC [Bacteroidales bacterium]
MRRSKILTTTASALALAFVVFSCKSNLSEAEKLDLSVIPLQTVDDMFYVQSENGRLKMRVVAPRMEVYEFDTLSYDLFPKGFHVYAYAEDGVLETTIVAKKARHDKYPGRKDDELWSAFGDVVIRNIVKQETMETDTLYWDSKTHEIYTDCYIRLSSPSGYMQGIGMRSDEMARNAILHRPFDNEFLLDNDTTKVMIDSVNFIGPLLKK